LSYFKNNPNFRLYYSDTDSIIIDTPLPDYLVGTKLGQVKLEHVINRGIFFILAPSASLAIALLLLPTLCFLLKA
jgi:hypothetical protein